MAVAKEVRVTIYPVQDQKKHHDKFVIYLFTHKKFVICNYLDKFIISNYLDFFSQKKKYLDFISYWDNHISMHINLWN